MNKEKAAENFIKLQYSKWSIIMSEDFNFGKTKIEVPNFDFKKVVFAYFSSSIVKKDRKSNFLVKMTV